MPPNRTEAAVLVLWPAVAYGIGQLRRGDRGAYWTLGVSLGFPLGMVTLILHVFS